ncbi:MAG: hypothetical protein GXX79_19425 [Actinomycetales bacterium]|nr:hypothetical protein [Actinomycetales bacterium]
MGVGGRLVVDYGTLNGQQQVFADVRDGLPEVGARLTGGVEHAGLGAGEFAGTVQPTLDGFATAWAQVIHACGGAVGGLADLLQAAVERYADVDEETASAARSLAGAGAAR